MTPRSFVDTMAISEPEIPDTAQHYLVCESEDCKRNCLFYCNLCHQSMCEQCREEHLKFPESKNHEVVPYKQRKRKLPTEKCKIHPYKELDILCKECNKHLCSKCCTLQDHQGHTFVDLEAIYSENCEKCKQEILNIRQYFFPASQSLQEEIKDNAKEIKSIFDHIRTSIKTESMTLKSLVDEVTLENIEQVDKLEESLLELLESQTKIFDDYISHLNNLIKDFHSYLSFNKIQNNPLINSIADALKIKSIPETTRPVLPVFTAGTFTKYGVANLLGKTYLPDIKPEIRTIKSMEAFIREFRIKGYNCKLKRTLVVNKVREYKLPDILDRVIGWHISVCKPGILFVSDRIGNFFHINLKENNFFFCYHLVQELAFIQSPRMVISISQTEKKT